MERRRAACKSSLASSAAPSSATHVPLRRAKSLLFDYMHIGSSLVDDAGSRQPVASGTAASAALAAAGGGGANSMVHRRRSISSIVRERRDFIDDYDYVYEHTAFDNLDRWKSARRQRVPERLLSRAEEAKRLLEEEEARRIRKVKTYSEMMQQRQSRQQQQQQQQQQKHSQEMFSPYSFNDFLQESHERALRHRPVDDFDDDAVDTYDEENKENDVTCHKRLTTADSVDSQSEGSKSSEGASAEDHRLGSDEGSDERLASPVELWATVATTVASASTDSGVDSLTGAGGGHSGAASSPQMLEAGMRVAAVGLHSSATAAISSCAKSAANSFRSPEACAPANSNELVIRLFINPSSDIFGFTLTQEGHKVVVESVDEDGVADLAGLKQGDEVISLNGVLADSPSSVPSSMDLALMTGQLEMVIYRPEVATTEETAEMYERRSNFKEKLARFCSGELQSQSLTGRDSADSNSRTRSEERTRSGARDSDAPQSLIEPRLVERRKSQLFIHSLQADQDDSMFRKHAHKDERRLSQTDLAIEEQLVLKRKNSLSQSLIDSVVEKKSPADEIEPQIIERKKAEFIRHAQTETITKSKDRVKSEINVEQHLVLQRKASIENCALRSEEARLVTDIPNVAIAQIKASIEGSNAHCLSTDDGAVANAKSPSVDVETTLEERKASFFEQSGGRLERPAIDLPIERSLIAQRKANLLESAELASQKAGRALDLDIQPKLIEQRKANFLESISKCDKPVKEIDIEPRTVEKKLLALQLNAHEGPLSDSLRCGSINAGSGSSSQGNTFGVNSASSNSGSQRVELTVNSMQSKPKIEVVIEPDLIRKRKEALFCSSATTNEIERRRAKLANIEAEVYGTVCTNEDDEDGDDDQVDNDNGDFGNNSNSARRGAPHHSQSSLKESRVGSNAYVPPDAKGVPVQLKNDKHTLEHQQQQQQQRQQQNHLSSVRAPSKVQFEISYSRPPSMLEPFETSTGAGTAGENTLSCNMAVRTCTSPIGEVRREVVSNVMLTSTASGSAILSGSDRNESPAHLSDLSPDSEPVTATTGACGVTGVTVRDTLSVHTEVGSTANVAYDGHYDDLSKTKKSRSDIEEMSKLAGSPDETRLASWQATHNSSRRELSDIVFDSTTDERAEVSRSGLCSSQLGESKNASARDSGFKTSVQNSVSPHTSKDSAMQSSCASLPAHEVEMLKPQSTAPFNTTGATRNVTVMQQEHTNVKPVATTDNLYGNASEASVRFDGGIGSTESDEIYTVYHNEASLHANLSSSSSLSTPSSPPQHLSSPPDDDHPQHPDPRVNYQVFHGDDDKVSTYDRLPSQPPKNHNKGPAPPPPVGVLPYGEGSEQERQELLYENAAQLQRSRDWREPSEQKRYFYANRQRRPEADDAVSLRSPGASVQPPTLASAADQPPANSALLDRHNEIGREPDAASVVSAAAASAVTEHLAAATDSVKRANVAGDAPQGYRGESVISSAAAESDRYAPQRVGHLSNGISQSNNAASSARSGDVVEYVSRESLRNLNAVGDHSTLEGSKLNLLSTTTTKRHDGVSSASSIRESGYERQQENGGVSSPDYDYVYTEQPSNYGTPSQSYMSSPPKLHQRQQQQQQGLQDERQPQAQQHLSQNQLQIQQKRPQGQNQGYPPPAIQQQRTQHDHHSSAVQVQQTAQAHRFQQQQQHQQLLQHQQSQQPFHGVQQCQTGGDYRQAGEEIYENTRSYPIKSPQEDIYANSGYGLASSAFGGRDAVAPHASSQLNTALASQGAQSVARGEPPPAAVVADSSGSSNIGGGVGRAVSGMFGHEIYENVETYAKTQDYLNNLRKPSVTSEDFYEAPRPAHLADGRLLSVASVIKPNVDNLHRSRSQPFVGEPVPGDISSSSRPRMTMQRNSADCLLLAGEQRQRVVDAPPTRQAVMPNPNIYSVESGRPAPNAGQWQLSKDVEVRPPLNDGYNPPCTNGSFPVASQHHRPPPGAHAADAPVATLHNHHNQSVVPAPHLHQHQQQSQQQQHHQQLQAVHQNPTYGSLPSHHPHVYHLHQQQQHQQREQHSKQMYVQNPSDLSHPRQQQQQHQQQQQQPAPQMQQDMQQVQLAVSHHKPPGVNVSSVSLNYNGCLAATAPVGAAVGQQQPPIYSQTVVQHRQQQPQQRQQLPIQQAAAPPSASRPLPTAAAGSSCAAGSTSSGAVSAAAFGGEGAPQPLSISGKKRCSLCGAELGRGAAMVIESLQLHFHLNCFRCCVCRQRLGNGTCGTDVRVRNAKLHCHNCYSNDEAGVKLSRV